jgi:transposase
MSIQRRKFTKEFKIQIIREIDNGTPVAQLSRQHQIQESLIHKWRKQFSKDPVHAFSGNGIPSTQEAKMAQLERTIGKLYLENEFLKKTINHFEMLRSQKD